MVEDQENHTPAPPHLIGLGDGISKQKKTDWRFFSP